MATDARTSGDLRALNRVRLLRAIHDSGASRTRAQLTHDLDLARGTASVLIAGLADDRLIAESPGDEARQGRGRPTLVPGPHPEGPLVLAADLREDSWDVAVCAIGGAFTVVESARHDGTPSGALRPLAAAIDRFRTSRVAAVGMAVAGPVRSGHIVDISHLGWEDVDVHAYVGDVTVGNDARLAGVAEARRGRLKDVAVGLHLHIDFDPGGTLLLDGSPMAGASDTAGEFGHMPLATMSPSREDPCLCGARGCWSLRVGANALLRHFGLAAGGGRGRAMAERILATTDQKSQAAVAENARALGEGVAALVNALDPAAVTLSGMGVELLALARHEIEPAYLAGLMAFRRPRPAPILPSALGRSAPLIGAMESAFDAFLTPAALQSWRERVHR